MGVVIDKRISSQSKQPEILVRWGERQPQWEVPVWLEVF
jgi:hypothetical protein